MFKKIAIITFATFLLGARLSLPALAAATIRYITLPMSVTTISFTANVDKALPTGTIIQLSTGDTLEVGAIYNGLKFTARVNSATSFDLTAPDSKALATGSILKIYMGSTNTSNPDASGAIVRTYVAPTTTTSSTTTTTTSTTTTTLQPPPGGYGMIDYITGGGTMETNFFGLIGEPVIGLATGAGSTIQLGALYTLLEAAPPTGEAAYGTVPLYISRADNDIKITWEAAFINPNIYVMVGDGSGRYANDYDAAKWFKVFSGGAVASGLPAELGSFAKSTDGFLLHQTQFAAGTPEAYYKGLQTGFNDPTLVYQGVQIFTSAEAVGKANLYFPQGYTLFELPVWMNVPSIPNSLNGQLDTSAVGDELYDYSMNKSSYTSGTWVGALPNFEKARGYYLRILNSPKTITFMGKIELAPVGIDLNSGYSMVGNPYPTSKEINDVFTGIDSPDELYDRYANKKTHVTGGWVGANFRFGLTDGFWYRRMTTTVYNWRLTP